jgi:RNA polymerase sigma-70 factor (ECF subfamily)
VIHRIAVDTDDDLVARAADGDTAAFEAIYRRHADRVFVLLTRLLGPDREREDLLQDTFVRLHPALGRFRGECALQTLIYRIATRVAIDHMRRRRPIAELDLDAEIDPGRSPADQAARREELRGALAVLATLKPQHRVAFVLHDVMSLSHEEVARIVETKPDAARMRVAAARRAIAKARARE